jgi:glycosyltransferase involved in cell wall biosynthesis
MQAAGANAAQFDVPAPAAVAPSAADLARARADIFAGDIDFTGDNDSGSRPVVLAVGRLAPQKGFDVLVEAAARWQAGPCPPRTVIAGSGPLAKQLADQARQVGADVRLLGERTDVPALLAVADVFVLPSRWEARALVLQEAMRAGRAIVATSSGGTAGLVGEDAAVLVPPGDAAALAGAVSAVLADRGLATRLGLAARERAAALPSQQDAVGRALAVYRRLTGNVG